MRPCPKRVGCKSIKKIPFLPNLSAQTREKTAHQLLALLPEHPPRHGRSGVEHRLGVTPEALLGIVGAPHHAAHLRPSDRPGAHDARLDRDVERALLQILAPRASRQRPSGPASRRGPWGRPGFRRGCAPARSPHRRPRRPHRWAPPVVLTPFAPRLVPGA